MTAESASPRSVFFSDFFKGNDYFIDEKVAVLRFGNAYNVYDAEGNKLGSVLQSVPGWHKFLRLFLKKKMFPFTLRLMDNHQHTLLTLYRDWTFWMSHIAILDENDERIGSVKQQFRFLNSRFKIYGVRKKVGEINGDWKGWNFTIIDAHHMTIGSINKQWAGLGKELLTTADKYHVAIDRSYTDETAKKLILATAITIDMVLKESR